MEDVLKTIAFLASELLRNSHSSIPVQKTIATAKRIRFKTRSMEIASALPGKLTNSFGKVEQKRFESKKKEV